MRSHRSCIRSEAYGRALHQPTSPDSGPALRASRVSREPHKVSIGLWRDSGVRSGLSQGLSNGALYFVRNIFSLFFSQLDARMYSHCNYMNLR